MSRDESTKVNELQSTRKYGVFMGVVFVVGTVCGAGLLAMPRIVTEAGWAGIPILIACGCIASYSAKIQADCWALARSRYPEYTMRRVADPYPEIGFRAAGKLGRYATRICIDISLYGLAIVYLIMISENITNLMKSIGGVEFYSCYMMMIICVALTPLTWIGTPKDFWQAGVLAAFTSVVASLLIVVGVALDKDLHVDAVKPNVSFRSLTSSFGMMMFAFEGASCFPTIQTDMLDPSKFPMASMVGMLITLSLYALPGFTGFIIFGNDMTANVLNALTPGVVSYAINIVFTSHMLMAFIIVLNPISQQIEGFFRLPDKFSWKRVLISTSCTAVALFIALSIPNFSVFLSLVGGSAVACTSFVFPLLFYYLLSHKRSPIVPSRAHSEISTVVEEIEEIDATVGGIITTEPRPNWVHLHINRFTKILIVSISLLCLFAGLSATYFAFYDIATGGSSFTVPCYVNISVE